MFMDLCCKSRCTELVVKVSPFIRTNFSSSCAFLASTTVDLFKLNVALEMWVMCTRNISEEQWNMPDVLNLIQAIVKKPSYQPYTSTETASKFASHKWRALTILVTKMQTRDTPLEELLFSEALEALDQSSFEAIPFVFEFLSVLLYKRCLLEGTHVCGAITVSHIMVPQVLQKVGRVEQLLEAAWKSFSETKRKSLQLIAAFVDVIFHPVIFHMVPVSGEVNSLSSSDFFIW